MRGTVLRKRYSRKSFCMIHVSIFFFSLWRRCWSWIPIALSMTRLLRLSYIYEQLGLVLPCQPWFPTLLRLAPLRRWNNSNANLAQLSLHSQFESMILTLLPYGIRDAGRQWRFNCQNKCYAVTASHKLTKRGLSATDNDGTRITATLEINRGRIKWAQTKSIDDSNAEDNLPEHRALTKISLKLSVLRKQRLAAWLYIPYMILYIHCIVSVYTWYSNNCPKNKVCRRSGLIAYERYSYY